MWILQRFSPCLSLSSKKSCSPSTKVVWFSFRMDHSVYCLPTSCLRQCLGLFVWCILPYLSSTSFSPKRRVCAAAYVVCRHLAGKHHHWTHPGYAYHVCTYPPVRSCAILSPDNVFKNVDTFEFPDSDDTLWKGNNMGGGCVDDKADFASGSDSNIPSCK